mmetsp:Transcript_10385/g.15959  ORF Transcript_10385/g.15959 Transcript_10385/m.15959 type:complete len:174 (-) Transcript_10385:176-697(-)
MEMSYEPRKVAFRALSRNKWELHNKMRLNASEYFHAFMESKFVVSPPGFGRQCRREWEALLSGAIPVREAWLGLERLYEELPTVAVENWATVTKEFLEAKWQEFQANRHRYDARKLYFPYWLDKVLPPGSRPPSVPRHLRALTYQVTGNTKAKCRHLPVKGPIGFLKAEQKKR